ncbi:hypothetical protein P2R12_16135 [Cytobacillus oceanisediminis]|uniref:ADP-ribosyltransferase-containing protein n=1 Tax=Cytobacillus oceanisediminis TaxID=665099 RepID=UPI0023DC9B6B|nr:hypothetical protein [Cytobacillus oceanisediminis]MDF2038488.1 hypothetical protein [Cytobacillus oceanisediminis]
MSLLIVYHGSTRKFDHFHKEQAIQKTMKEFDTLGIWFSSDFDSAKAFAIGTETVIEKSDTEFWEDGLPKVVEYDKQVLGFIYKVYIDEPVLKDYDSFEHFMNERDPYCDYASTKKRHLTWKDKAILLNKDEANAEFRKSLTKQGYDGIAVRKMDIETVDKEMYCIFSDDLLQIADVFSLE